MTNTCPQFPYIPVKWEMEGLIRVKAYILSLGHVHYTVADGQGDGRMLSGGRQVTQACY